MNIVSLSFEEPLIITIHDQVVKIIPFLPHEPGSIKFGIEAPRSINIHREEIFQAIQLKLQTISE